MIRYYVTDRRRGDLDRCVERAIRDGVDMIQVREKDLSARELLRLVCRVRDAAAGSNTRILVNDRLDIALAANIHGVHLPGRGLPAAVVRPHVRVMGCSVHSVDEAVRAAQDGVDFVVFGPVFDTPGKTPHGLEALRSVAEAVRIPVLAIGGLSAERIADVLAAGAAGFAAIRYFQSD
jgi:thiamine-phosphate pyrophosphorylase